MKKEGAELKSLFEYYGFTEADVKDYPVITGILKQLTPERVENEIREVQAVELPPELQKWVDEYEKMAGGGGRPYFIWKWVYHACQIVTFPTVPQDYQLHVWETKVLLMMLDTLLDDVADKRQNRGFLTAILNVVSEHSGFPAHGLTGRELEYVSFTKKLWDDISGTMKEFPRYSDLCEVFAFDIEQLLNTMRYSALINRRPYLINPAEFWNYLSHNMCAMLCCTVDLMCSPAIDLQQTGKIREIFWCAQKMARIGNWVSTWEREVTEQDYTSGVLAYAVRRNAISIDDLHNRDEADIRKRIKMARVEYELLTEWEQNYGLLSSDFGAPDDFLEGLRRFIVLHLSSRGYK